MNIMMSAEVEPTAMPSIKNIVKVGKTNHKN